jgi:hypothetical protein
VDRVRGESHEISRESTIVYSVARRERTQRQRDGLNLRGFRICFFGNSMVLGDFVRLKQNFANGMRE